VNPTLEVGAVGLEVYSTPHTDANGAPDPALDPEPAAVALIDSAKVSLLVNAYSLTLLSVATAIIGRHQAGVPTRVVMDATEYAAPTSRGPSLLAAGVDLRVWGSEYELAHEKVIVVDGAAVWSGSWNFSTSAETVNREVATVVTGVKVRTRLAPLLTAQIQATYAAGRVPQEAA
jgi:phosphatidylserine/phosphatidylglycerophosphate/cardiolipin synthase-like enzyme